MRNLLMWSVQPMNLGSGIGIIFSRVWLQINQLLCLDSIREYGTLSSGFVELSRLGPDHYKSTWASSLCSYSHYICFMVLIFCLVNLFITLYCISLNFNSNSCPHVFEPTIYQLRNLIKYCITTAHSINHN